MPKKVSLIYNPTNRDFSCFYDRENNRTPYIIKSKTITEMPIDVADHVKKHLADFVMNERTIKTNHEDELREVMKEISVD